jgi:hypothetical protein
MLTNIAVMRSWGNTRVLSYEVQEIAHITLIGTMIVSNLHAGRLQSP